MIIKKITSKLQKKIFLPYSQQQCDVAATPIFLWISCNTIYKKKSYDEQKKDKYLFVVVLSTHKTKIIQRRREDRELHYILL